MLLHTGSVSSELALAQRNARPHSHTQGGPCLACRERGFDGWHLRANGGCLYLTLWTSCECQLVAVVSVVSCDHLFLMVRNVVYANDAHLVNHQTGAIFKHTA